MTNEQETGLLPMRPPPTESATDHVPVRAVDAVDQAPRRGLTSELTQLDRQPSADSAASLLARQAAALTGAAAVMLRHQDYLVVAAAEPASAVWLNSALVLSDPALAGLAPVQAALTGQAVEAGGVASAAWPLLHQPHQALPLLHNDILLGVLIAAGPTATDACLLERLSDLAALASQALSLPQPRNGALQHDLAVMHELSRVVSGGGQAAMLEQLVATIASALGVRRCLLRLPDEQGRLIIHARHGRTGPLTPPLVLGDDEIAEVYLNGQPRIINQPASDSTDRANWAIQRAIHVPLNAGSRTIGVLTVADPVPDRPFSTDDLRVLTTSAHLVALAIEYDRLFVIAQDTSSHLAAMLAAIPDSVIVIDKNLRVVELNGATRQLLQLPTAVAGRGPLQELLDRLPIVLPNGYRARIDDLAPVQALRQDETVTTEFHLMLDPDLPTICQCHAAPLHDASGRVVGAIGITRDISVERRLLGYVEAQQRSLKTIISGLPEGVIVAEAPSGQIIAANPAAEQLLGLALQGETAPRVTDLAFGQPDGNAFPAGEGPIARSFGHGERCLSAEISYTAPGRPSRILLINAAPLADPGVTARAGVLVFQDITASKEEQQRRDDFLSAVSHELKTPLTTIKGYTDLIQRRLTRDSTIDRYRRPLGTIHHQIDRMTRLVNDLLDLSRIEGDLFEIELELVKLNEVVSHALEHARVAAAFHQFALELPPAPVTIRADRGRLEQVLGNLLSNAAKYSPEGSTITIGLASVGAEALVSCRDEGIGISPQHQELLFKRYYRVPGTTSNGLGLGLYISHEIVTRHRGRLWVESRPGRGSTFWLAFPLVAPPETGPSGA